MTIAQNSDYYLGLYLAVAWLGAVIVPGNTRWSLAEHEFAYADAPPHLLAVDGAFAHFAGPLTAARPIPTIFMEDGEAPEAMVPFESLIGGVAPVADREASKDDLYGIFYTGGPTGRPRAGPVRRGRAARPRRARDRTQLG